MWQACNKPNGTANQRTKAKVDFNYHVKPILSDKCFACHGPDVKKRQADFRLDTEEGAFKALKSDPHNFAIVKGNLSPKRISSQGVDRARRRIQTALHQLSASKPYVGVFLGSKIEFSPQDLADLKGIRKQIVSVDI